MNNLWVKNLVPHFIAFIILFIVAYSFFSQASFGGKVLYQHDNVQARATQTEIMKFKKETGKAPLWTNSQFCGMPAYQMYQEDRANLTAPFFKISLFGQEMTEPHAGILVAMLCAYLLLIVLRVDWRLAIPGAIAFGLSNYYLDITYAGHSTKVFALAYTCGIFAGAILAFRGKYWLGGGILALFTALQIYINHLQITYYTFLFLGILGIIELVRAIISKSYLPFVWAALALLLGTTFGVLSNTSKLWTTYEYTPETIRGGSELTSKAGQGSGLDFDYAFRWSNTIPELITLIIPNYMGGGAKQDYAGTQTYDRLIQAGVPPNQLSGTANAALYRGNQPFVGVAIYFGIVLVLLSLIGIVISRNQYKWWIFAVLILSLLISCGPHTPIFRVMFDTLPMFNKFRSVSMVLGFGQLAVVVLGLLGIHALLDSQIEADKKWKALWGSGAALAGISVIAWLMADTSGKIDENFKQISDLIISDRSAMIRNDVFRGLFFIGAVVVLGWLFIKNNLNSLIFSIGLGLLILIDLFMMDARVTGSAEYREEEIKDEASAYLMPTDTMLQKDTDPYYRVLDLARSGDPITNAFTSFYHKSFGGYHAAKLMRFQEVVDTCLRVPMQFIGQNVAQTDVPVETILSNPNAAANLFGMLNVKYFLLNRKDQPVFALNPKVMGNAWFVREYKIVENGDAELKGLPDLDPGQTALIQKSFAESVKGLNIQYDSTNTIFLTKYNPDNMEYTYSAKTDQLAVFSDIYYPPSKGWNLYLNGKLYEPFIKANYLVRAVKLPAGQNQKLEMKFEPVSYYQGEKISMISSALVLILLILGIYLFLKKYALPVPNTLPAFVAAVRSKSDSKKTKPGSTIKRSKK